MNGRLGGTRRRATAALVSCLAASLVIQAAAPAPVAAQAPAPKRIAIIRAADWMGSEWGEDAIRVGLQESDLESGRDYELSVTSAQGDLATLPSLIDAAIDSRASVIVALQDPTLAVAVQRARSVPIVFHLLSDPFAVGAGKSDTDHLPNVTGVYSPGLGDAEQTRRVELIRRVLPGATRIGILFSPEDRLSVSFKDRMTKAAEQAGLQVIAVPVSTAADASDATRSLCGKKVDAIELFGNAAHAGFAGVIQVARDCRIPVFSPSPFEVMQGAVLSFAADFQEGGVVAGKMIARILKGESPAAIPFYRVQSTKLVVNPGDASRIGVTLPPGLVKEANEVVGDSAKK